MRVPRPLIPVVVCAPFLALVAGAAIAAEHQMAMAAMSDADIIASATKAAPAAIGKDATVLAANADGTMRVVRQGSNGFTCMTDNPESPGPDPMCADANAMEWLGTYLAKKTPPAGKVGLVYMLEGGTDASNTDPYAKKPTAENHWIKTGPHVMVLGATTMMQGYPTAPDPDTAQPYVMWAGTPYEHLMIPIQ